jgi:chromate transporter
VRLIRGPVGRMDTVSRPPAEPVPLATIAREWTRIGVIGFGGPPAHIALLRKLCVAKRGWMSASEFEDGIAATSLLPGPASTQLAIFCAWRLRGAVGAVLGGFCFIVPGLIAILALSELFLARHPPLWVLGAAAGAGSAVPAVAVRAAASLAPGSWKRASGLPAGRVRWLIYLAAGGAAAATAGPYLVLVVFGCGLVEVAARVRTGPDGAGPAGAAAGRTGPDGAGPAGAAPGRTGPGGQSAGDAGPGGPAGPDTGSQGRSWAMLPLLAAPAVAIGGLGALVWEAFKVGALSYGGGFVIIPLMQHDVVTTYHWMSGAKFLSVVALGQVTPGPVVLTVAAVGYAAAGIGGGLLAALVAFAPSFVFVIAGGPQFGRIRSSARVQSFLTGAGPAAVGAIAGAAVPLGLELSHVWQVGLLVVAAGWLLVLRRGTVTALLGAGALGVIAALAGTPLGH